MKKVILMILVLTFIIPSVSEAQLVKVWEYVLPVGASNTFKLINSDEIVFTGISLSQSESIGIGKLNSSGAEAWYHETVLGKYAQPDDVPTIINNNEISFVSSYAILNQDSRITTINHLLSTYSETGSLISSTLLNKSSYEDLGDYISRSTYTGGLKINNKGDVVFITNPYWRVTCSDNTVDYGSATYAINYYTYNNSNYTWEHRESKADFIHHKGYISDFTPDGSIVIIETLEDRTGNNCPFNPLVQNPFTTTIKKYSAAGVLLWASELSHRYGNILCQTDDLIIVRSYGPWTDQRITAYAVQTGAVVWTYNMQGNHIPVNADVYTDKLLLQVQATDANDRTVTHFYLLDVATGAVLRTMAFTDRAFDDRNNNWFDNEGNIYLLNTVYYNEGLGDYGITCYDINFNQLWRSSFGNTRIYRLLEIDDNKNIYLYGRDVFGNTAWKIMKYTQGTTLTLKDSQNKALSNTDFYLIKVADDAPNFTPDTLGIVTTDTDGKIELKPVQ